MIFFPLFWFSFSGTPITCNLHLCLSSLFPLTLEPLLFLSFDWKFSCSSFIWGILCCIYLFLRVFYFIFILKIILFAIFFDFWCKFWVFKMVLCVFSCFIPFSLLVTYFEIESNISIYSVHGFGVFSLFVVLIFYLFSFLVILGFNFVFCCLFLHGINFIRVLEWVMVHGSYSNFIELHLFPPPKKIEWLAFWIPDSVSLLYFYLGLFPSLSPLSLDCSVKSLLQHFLLRLSFKSS